MQTNRVTVSTIFANPPSKVYETGLRNGRCRRLCFVAKAKLAVEGDVSEKEAVSVNDKNGDTS